jgi:hypothetical protein
MRGMRASEERVHESHGCVSGVRRPPGSAVVCLCCCYCRALFKQRFQLASNFISSYHQIMCHVPVIRDIHECCWIS